jgi:hypothetical protein
MLLHTSLFIKDRESAANCDGQLRILSPETVVEVVSICLFGVERPQRESDFRASLLQELHFVFAESASFGLGDAGFDLSKRRARSLRRADNVLDH